MTGVDAAAAASSKQPKNASDGKSKGQKKKKAKKEKPPGTSIVDENTEPNDVVEALLREFMYRKGLGHILDAFDESRPRGDKTINSVKAIYKALNLEEIYARMREADKGVSVFEVLVAHSFKKPEEDAGAAKAGGNRDDAAASVKIEELEEKVRELEESLHDAREDGARAEKELADLRRKFELQKNELQQLQSEKNGGGGDDDNAGGEALSTPQRSRFGLTALPTLSGQKKDPLADGGVVVGKGVLKVNTNKGKKTPPGQKKAVKFVDNEEWLKVEDVRKAASVRSRHPWWCLTCFTCLRERGGGRQGGGRQSDADRERPRGRGAEAAESNPSLHVSSLVLLICFCRHLQQRSSRCYRWFTIATLTPPRF